MSVIWASKLCCINNRLRLQNQHSFLQEKKCEIYSACFWCFFFVEQNTKVAISENSSEDLCVIFKTL